MPKDAGGTPHAVLLVGHEKVSHADELACERAGIENDSANVLSLAGGGHSTRVRAEAASRKAGDTPVDDLAVRRQEEDLRRALRRARRALRADGTVRQVEALIGDQAG